MYIADSGCSMVRAVDPDTDMIRPLVGVASGWCQDEYPIPVETIYFYMLRSVVVGPDEELYIVDSGCGGGKVLVAGDDGMVRLFAGGGTETGEGALANEADLDNPWDVAVADDGTVYIAEYDGNRIRVVPPGPEGERRIYTIAGTGVQGDDGDGGMAVAATLDRPTDIALGGDGTLYINLYYRNRVRRVDPSGRIWAFAGTGSSTYNGDGIDALDASLHYPEDVDVADDGTVYIADTHHQRIRRVRNGTITTIAGNGERGSTGDLALQWRRGSTIPGEWPWRPTTR